MNSVNSYYEQPSHGSEDEVENSTRRRAPTRRTRVTTAPARSTPGEPAVNQTQTVQEESNATPATEVVTPRQNFTPDLSVHLPDAITFRYSLVRDMLKMNTIPKFSGGDIDDWLEQFHAIVDDVEPTDRELVYMMKNVMKGSALICLAVCKGKTFKDHVEVLTRKYRGPGAKWKRLSLLEDTRQSFRATIDDFYQDLETNCKKAESLMQGSDPQDYKVPQQFLVQIFIKGLLSDHVREKLYAMDYKTLHEYYIQARTIESSIMVSAGQKRGASGNLSYGHNK